MSRPCVVTMTEPQLYGDRWRVKFRYNAELVDLIKDAVDWRDREWDREDKCWWVDDTEVARLASEMTDAGFTVKWEDAEGETTDAKEDPLNSSGPPPDWAQPTWAETVLTAVGPERRDAVFRALSRILHPDTATGDGDLMRELLAARELVNGRTDAA